MLKPLTMKMTANCGKFFKRQEYQTIWLAFWEICMQIKKQQLEACMEQLIGSGLRKEYDRAVCCHPVCLTYMLSTSWEMPGWIWKAWIKTGGRNINNLRNADDTTLMEESEEELESLFEGEGGEWKSQLKTKYLKKLRSWHLAPLPHGK